MAWPLILRMIRLRQAEWEKDLPDETMRARYNNLSIMLEIEPGDYIIVPKVSVEEDYVCRSFVIAKCMKINDCIIRIVV